METHTPFSIEQSLEILSRPRSTFETLEEINNIGVRHYVENPAEHQTKQNVNPENKINEAETFRWTIWKQKTISKDRSQKDDSETFLFSMYTAFQRRYDRLWLTYVGKFILRFLPLFVSVWTYGDVALDGFQAKLYYDYSTIGITNCEHGDVSLDIQNNITGKMNVNVHKISQNYFWFSVWSFCLPIFMLNLTSYSLFGIYGSYNDPDRKLLHKCKIFISSKPIVIRILFLVIWVPLESFIRMSVAYYVFVPFSALYFSIVIAFLGPSDSKELQDIAKLECCDLCYWNIDLVSIVRLYENIGEAVPQTILSMTFLVNYYHCPELVTYNLFGIEIPTAIVSIFFSLGSLVITFLTTLPACISWANRTKTQIAERKHTKKMLKRTQTV